MSAVCPRPATAPAQETRSPSPGPSPLRVAVRHALATWSLRVAYVTQGAAAGPAHDARHQLRHVFATAERLLREADAHLDQVVSCEVFVREPEARRTIETLLCDGVAHWPGRARLVRQPPGASVPVDVAVTLLVSQPDPAAHAL
ncbi:RidA family protein [Acidovorax sp. sic0104]|uniref:RidA family protein n=1 Tax=Acidovorax sp. sic0104 TaxID=2854784 RepID=UPI001C46644E|nr:RidA family protein [Acidovorax sp. sic0104]MBV7543193.1 hypothetical protein [Acidovorax sp. sic0104]